MLPSRQSLEYTTIPGRTVSYQVVQDKNDESSADESHVTLLGDQMKYRRKRSSGSIALLTVVALFIIACFGTIWYLSLKLQQAQSHRNNHPTFIRTGAELGDCGSSIAEARAAGCTFDRMTWLWLPEPCQKPHRALSEDWKSRTNWRFYTDVELSAENEVSWSEVENHPTVFTPYIYHKVHCSYSWQKTYAILRDRLPIDSNTLSDHHMKHCQMVLLNEFFHEDVNCTEAVDGICPIQLNQQFTTCGYF